VFTSSEYAVMTLTDFRASLGLSLEQCAIALGLSAASKSWLSEIENGKRDASLRLALRIERWSDGAVSAASICAELRGGDQHTKPTSSDEDATLPKSETVGAGAEIGDVQ
jgi:transcriptional regulator with XRE-family HTH domain